MHLKLWIAIGYIHKLIKQNLVVVICYTSKALCIAGCLACYQETHRIGFSEQMGILFAHARDETNILCSAPFVNFWTRGGGFLNGRSTFYERSCQERWKIITTLHTFLTLWIPIVFAGTLDEDILIIKVRTERDKSPKEWSFEFDLTKIKMFPGEDKQWRLVSRCWIFIVKSHGVIYWDDRQIRDPIWEGNFELERIFLQLWSKLSSYFRQPPSFKLLQTTLSLLLLLSHWGL